MNSSPRATSAMVQLALRWEAPQRPSSFAPWSVPRFLHHTLSDATLSARSPAEGQGKGHGAALYSDPLPLFSCRRLGQRGACGPFGVEAGAFSIHFLVLLPLQNVSFCLVHARLDRAARPRGRAVMTARAEASAAQREGRGEERCRKKVTHFLETAAYFSVERRRERSARLAPGGPVSVLLWSLEPRETPLHHRSAGATGQGVKNVAGGA